MVLLDRARSFARGADDHLQAHVSFVFRAADPDSPLLAPSLREGASADPANCTHEIAPFVEKEPSRPALSLAVQ
ncbi:MAG: hypothetical protein M3R46_12730, partial [Actinomycetota bacterium]|nr:hypothetical protein [Actinomycetota bacterium]